METLPIDPFGFGPFARGLTLGLAVAAPVGPMSLLCMRQTLTRGSLAGMVSGLGAATADGVYGAIAAFGLVTVTEILIGQHAWLPALGGLAMAYLGVGAMRTRPAEAAGAERSGGLARSYAGTFGLTMMNPSTILSPAALFAGLGLGGDGDSDGSTAAMLVAGVFVGSALWWLAVTGGLSLARSRLSPRMQRAVNVAAGLVLVGFGLLAIWGVVA